MKKIVTLIFFALVLTSSSFASEPDSTFNFQSTDWTSADDLFANIEIANTAVNTAFSQDHKVQEDYEEEGSEWWHVEDEPLSSTHRATHLPTIQDAELHDAYLRANTYHPFTYLPYSRFSRNHRYRYGYGYRGYYSNVHPRHHYSYRAYYPGVYSRYHSNAAYYDPFIVTRAARRHVGVSWSIYADAYWPYSFYPKVVNANWLLPFVAYEIDRRRHDRRSRHQYRKRTRNHKHLENNHQVLSWDDKQQEKLVVVKTTKSSAEDQQDKVKEEERQKRAENYYQHVEEGRKRPSVE